MVRYYLIPRDLYEHLVICHRACGCSCRLPSTTSWSFIHSPAPMSAETEIHVSGRMEPEIAVYGDPPFNRSSTATKAWMDYVNQYSQNFSKLCEDSSYSRAND